MAPEHWLPERWLLDTNILLRLVWLNDKHSQSIENAVRLLADNGSQFFLTLQSVSEFWNVCTRPPGERSGLALSPEDAASGLQIIETQAKLLPDNSEVYAHWKRIVTAYQVRGVQVHDAKLVASMLSHNVPKILTLNARHFERYSEIQAISPGSFV